MYNIHNIYGNNYVMSFYHGQQRKLLEPLKVDNASTKMFHS